VGRGWPAWRQRRPATRRGSASRSPGRPASRPSQPPSTRRIAVSPSGRCAQTPTWSAAWPGSSYRTTTSSPSTAVCSTRRTYRQPNAGRVAPGRRSAFTSQRPEVLHQVLLLLVGEVEVLEGVVVVHHRQQRLEPTVVVEAALVMRPQAAQRCRAVHVGGRAVRLEVADADV